jgi:hypothetical protein
MNNSKVWSDLFVLVLLVLSPILLLGAVAIGVICLVILASQPQFTCCLSVMLALGALGSMLSGGRNRKEGKARAK